MTIGDVNEQGYCFRLVMFMDRRYPFGDVNKQYRLVFSDANELV